MDRRRFVLVSAGATLGLLLSAAGAFTYWRKRVVSAVCGPTMEYPGGPFYPGTEAFARETDLTQIEGRAERAKGQIIRVRGRVTDENCNPLVAARVEYWQACYSGRYNHPRETNTAYFDPNFKYWGMDFADENGEFSFLTVKPGSYLAEPNWVRPPHIHFRFNSNGFDDLITEMFFEGEPLNDADRLILGTEPALRPGVIVSFESANGKDQPPEGWFNVALVPRKK